MRILLLTTSFPLNYQDSNGIFVERLAQQLGKDNEVYVLAPAAQKRPALNTDRNYCLSTFSYAPAKWQILAQQNGGIPVTLKNKPWMWAFVSIFLASMLFCTLQKAKSADVIFANWSVCGVIAGLAGLIMRRPVITTFRGADANQINSSFIRRTLVKLCLLLNHRVITVSDDIAQQVLEVFPLKASMLKVIPNGVELPQVARKLKTNSKIQLIIVSSLIPRKHIQTVLSSLASLPEKFSLTIIGDGPEKNALQNFASSSRVLNRVRFLGNISPDEVKNWLLEADIFVTSSISEGRPNSVLEAMAAALPVVATDIPGHRELISPGVNGILFACNDSEMLSRALLKLQDENMRTNLGAAGRQFIIEHKLTWKNSATLYLNEFNKLLKD